ncbi:glycine betaine ABC transporter substrate-binding protein [Paraburkholderia azotifigens]|uniref:Glycine betaine ABC transporter substrate-binding protein n=1 Tax=Paraburkholderia azotifigens TaxID=2057004 RepID=A0A5C6V0V9_9BURK|nr:glycine betaine ABC transporter substrate-binding protein [Paraburkholderia azotifigens]TXC79223.1 glycine betaine ABC transporter substrate-binding protein [Paraburkholderia azotifigens]
MTRMLRLCKWLLPVVFLLTGAAAHAEDKSITIGVNNWAENIAVANMWKILLDEKGFKVQLQNADKALIYNSVAQGKIDLTFEVWLPAGDKPAFDKVKDRVVQIGPWFKEANLGLVVPDYVAVDSIDQLNANKTLFASSGRAKVVGIDSGSSLMQLTEKAKANYQLDYDIQSSSESAMVLSLERAIQRKEPVVVTLWKPHWIWSKYKLKYLKDPKGAYGASDSIYGIESPTFRKQHPDVERWLQQWKMDDNSLGSLMSEIIKQGASTPEKGAKVWIDANRTLVQQWTK